MRLRVVMPGLVDNGRYLLSTWKYLAVHIQLVLDEPLRRSSANA